MFQPVVESVVAPVFGAISQRVGVPIPAHPWVTFLTMVAAVILAARIVDTTSWASLGLGERAWKMSSFARAFGWGTAAILGTLALLWASGSVEIVGVAGDAGIGRSAEVTWSAVAFRLALLLAPAALWEELVFRGYLWTVARDAGGVRVARWTTAVAFGLVHIMNPGATALSTVVVVVAGWCLGAIREFTDSVMAAFAAHFVWNWFMAAVAHVAVSGLAFETPRYMTVVSGPIWWTGGVWGPEGGVAALLILSVGLVMSMRLARRVPTT